MCFPLLQRPAGALQGPVAGGHWPPEPPGALCCTEQNTRCLPRKQRELAANAHAPLAAQSLAWVASCCSSSGPSPGLEQLLITMPRLAAGVWCPRAGHRSGGEPGRIPAHCKWKLVACFACDWQCRLLSRHAKQPALIQQRLLVSAPPSVHFGPQQFEQCTRHACLPRVAERCPCRLPPCAPACSLSRRLSRRASGSKACWRTAASLM